MRNFSLTFLLLFLLASASAAGAQTIDTAVSIPYSTPNRGGLVVATAGEAAALVTGYARMQPAASTMPAAAAVFSQRIDDVLVGETAIPAASTIGAGRTYAEVSGSVNTAVAFVNPLAVEVIVSYHFTDLGGNDITAVPFTLAPNAQLTRFLDQAPFNARNFTGTFSFNASAPIAVTALRGVTNARSEFITSAQPIVAIPASINAGAVNLGHFADGGGWSTQVFLVNPTDSTLTGTVEFVNASGQVSSSTSYTIRARSSARLATPGVAQTAMNGAVRIAPSGGTSTPGGFTAYSLKNGDVLQAETAATPLTAAPVLRTYVEINLEDEDDDDDVDHEEEDDVVLSAIAISNTSATTATVNFELTDLNGIGVGTTAVLTIPPNGSLSRFVHELFPPLPDPFVGILRVSAGTTPIVLVSLRTRYNEREEFLMAAMPVSNEAGSSSTTDLFFPQIADGGGYSTQFILFSGITGQNTTGSLRFFSAAGQPLAIPFPVEN